MNPRIRAANRALTVSNCPPELKPLLGEIDEMAGVLAEEEVISLES